eukprot:15432920-Alexandrium_andersonii.AAC.1
MACCGLVSELISIALAPLGAARAPAAGSTEKSRSPDAWGAATWAAGSAPCKSSITTCRTTSSGKPAGQHRVLGLSDEPPMHCSGHSDNCETHPQMHPHALTD